jgi:hypothetical protein
MKTALLLILLAVTVFLTGCYPRDIVHTQRALERDLPQTRFRRQVAMAFGPGSMELARWIGGLVEAKQDQELSEYLDDVESIQFGLYETQNLPQMSEIDLPSRLQSRIGHDGWAVAASIRERDATVWVLYRDDGEEVRNLFVVFFQDDSLILMALSGHLNDLMQKITEDHELIPRLVPGGEGAHGP